MKTYLYLSTAIISVSLATSGNAWAQCVSTQDCTALGYTETSCPNGGVKCPFGNKWSCGGDSTTICKQESFTNTCTGAGQCGIGETCANLYKQCGNSTNYKYTCAGTGYSGGSGSACGGKYTACTCSSGYEWNSTYGVCSSAVCEVGWLYYSDGTCSSSKINDKTLLGIVIYSNGVSGGGWIITPKPIKTGILWSTGENDIPELTNYYTSTPPDIQSSCTNTNIITTFGDSTRFPAAWTAKNYKPIGTPSGKSWCLPSGGLLNKLNNSSTLAKVNAGITSAGGTKLGKVHYNSSQLNYFEYIWGSSERIYGEYIDESTGSYYEETCASTFSVNTDGEFSMDFSSKDSGYAAIMYTVRAVMEF